MLLLTGAGAALAGAGGVSMAGGSDGDRDAAVTETPTGSPVGTDTGTPEPDDGPNLLADLADPVFGYPLSAAETDDVTIDTVVDGLTNEGPGAHDGFPVQAGPDGESGEFPVEFVFDPVGVHVEPGELIQFEMVSGIHTVSSFHEKYQEPALPIPTRIPAGAPGFTSPPIAPGESWVYQFSTKGVYDLFCFPHVGFGMVMRVLVFDPAEDDLADDQFAAPTASPVPPNVDPVLTAPELDPGNIADAGTVAWDDLTIAVPGETSTATETETGTETAGATETGTETAGATETGTETATPSGTATETGTEESG